MNKHTPTPWALNVWTNGRRSIYKSIERKNVNYHPEIAEVWPTHNKNESRANAEFIVKACNAYDRTQQAMSSALRTINDTLRHEALSDGGRDSLIVVGIELKGLIDKDGSE